MFTCQPRMWRKKPQAKASEWPPEVERQWTFLQKECSPADPSTSPTETYLSVLRPRW